MTTRRHFLRGLGTLLAMPAIVRVSAIMPVRAMPVESISIVGAGDSSWGSWVVYGTDYRGVEVRYTIPMNGTITVPARTLIQGFGPAP